MAPFKSIGYHDGPLLALMAVELNVSVLYPTAAAAAGTPLDEAAGGHEALVPPFWPWQVQVTPPVMLVTLMGLPAVQVPEAAPHWPLAVTRGSELACQEPLVHDHQSPLMICW